MSQQKKEEFAQNLLAGMGDLDTKEQSRPRAFTVTGMHANSQEVARLRKELQDLQAKAASGNSTGMVLDPKSVKLSPWANRSELSYLTEDFKALKAAIEKTGGNVQAAGVYKDDAGDWVLVFGHRRRRACLELGLPFKVLELGGEINPQAIYEAMYAENTARKNLSVYEQGVSFKLALETGLYPSNRELADRLGCSHTWVNQCIAAASLPEEVIKCWPNPTDMTAADAKKIGDAIKTKEGREEVLLRASVIQEREEPLTASEVVMHLLHDDGVDGSEKPRALRVGKGKSYGTWRKDAKGNCYIKLSPVFKRDEIMRILKIAEEMAKEKPVLQEKAKAAPKKPAKTKEDADK